MVEQLAEALRGLRQRLAAEVPDQPGVLQITLPVTMQGAPSLLEWLDTQPLFPKFYWLHRKGDQEAAVCGQALCFDDAFSAQNWLQQQQHIDVRIWGMNAFDQVQIDGNLRRSSLFLPRIELLRQEQQLSLTLYLADTVSLQRDALKALALLQQLRAPDPLPPLQVQVISAHHLPEYSDWCCLLRQVLAEISQENFAKVVMARRTTLTLSNGLRAAAFLAASRQVNHNCFHFMLALDAQQSFIGSSPECLYHRKGRMLTTEALAGTVASSDNDNHARYLADWLMRDKKNQHENLLVVDDICQRLQGVVSGIDVMAASVIRLRKVQHLRRMIRCHLREADDADCLFRLQPTAAVAGLPREPVRQFIIQREAFQRGWYAGSAGYLSLRQAEFAVALRCALVEQQRVHLYAGAGIVAGSDPHEEWLEIESKAAGLRTLLDRGTTGRASSYTKQDEGCRSITK